MTRFDLTSLIATIAFFISVALFLTEILSFFEFLKFLLILEGVVFLFGAFSRVDNSNASNNSFWDLNFNSSVRFNQIRHMFGLIFFFIGNFIEKLQ